MMKSDRKLTNYMIFIVTYFLLFLIFSLQYGHVTNIMGRRNWGLNFKFGSEFLKIIGSFLLFLFLCHCYEWCFAVDWVHEKLLLDCLTSLICSLISGKRW